MKKQSDLNFYLTVVRERPVEFGRLNGFERLTELHNDWIKSFLLGREDLTLLAHRGSYKTTCLAIAIALSMVVFPNRMIIFMRKTDGDVAEIVLLIQKLLQSTAFQTLSLALWRKKLVLVKATNSEVDTNLKLSVKGSSQLIALGIGGSITGKHADVIFTDDIVTVKDRTSSSERTRTRLQYQELQNVKNRGGRIVNTGTPWHKEDAIEEMPNVQRFDCYKTGLISEMELRHLREVMPASLFAANYELKHIASEAVMFERAQFSEGSLFGAIGHIDAAYGGSDFTAYTLMKEQEDGRVLAFGKLFQGHVERALPELLQLHKFYGAGSLLIETNADKGYLAKHLREQGLIVSPYYEKMNKFMKVAIFLKGNWSNLYWLPETDPDYLRQVLDFTENVRHDDAPDSAASLLRKLKGNRGWVL